MLSNFYQLNDQFASASLQNGVFGILSLADFLAKRRYEYVSGPFLF